MRTRWTPCDFLISTCVYVSYPFIERVSDKNVEKCRGCSGQPSYLSLLRVSQLNMAMFGGSYIFSFYNIIQYFIILRLPILGFLLFSGLSDGLHSEV